ncbi:Glu-tRNA(Gln) amidotransferase subunit GatD [Candidatus Woesearchaeota archaeon]|jgi:glutamyl-tRNA(Gln) amidotransferase subunit D|nr:Glu-tRNA(Gln) amidotransferase subunit GatD [Candidatus Woesearchaeota archaeon]MBT7169687.1 Glu-tRNA(Gln) amidotransferase subunit GatD [Candidatus Woesearchaeota archaeon]MBT7474798.1 Glu-tRNA(Gln) amidotransferase subunit GatD [Candidatus Woesearchaeota archaeon]
MKTGDHIEIKTSTRLVKGILMPDSISGKLVLKLSSGYNIGIDQKNIKSKKILKKATKLVKKSTKIKQNKKLPKILILHTGGTIASKVSYETGGVIAKFKPEELLELIPELGNIANIETKLISNIFSEDMGFKDYNILAKEIKKAKDYEGIIITHGTDTLHYTSAALSFMLENLGFPVILVGSQRSSDRGSSDAAINMICATQFIINSDFAEVGICMHSSMDDGECAILPGLKSRKFHSSRRDAFQAVNGKPYALVNTKGKIKIVDNRFRKKQDSNTEANLFNEKLKIGILRAHPNLNSKEISCFNGFDGMILEGTGLGHFPINENPQILKELKKLNKEMPLIMTSQTIFGRVNMDVYSTGRELQKIVLSGEDMLTEVAFIKLAYLLSKKQDIALISENLKGEINNRISDEFL